MTWKIFWKTDTNHGHYRSALTASTANQVQAYQIPWQWSLLILAVILEANCSLKVPHPISVLQITFGDSIGHFVVLPDLFLPLEQALLGSYQTLLGPRDSSMVLTWYCLVAPQLIRVDTESPYRIEANPERDASIPVKFGNSGLLFAGAEKVMRSEPAPRWLIRIIVL